MSAEFGCQACGRSTCKAYSCAMCRSWVCEKCTGDEEATPSGSIRLCVGCMKERAQQLAKHPEGPRCRSCFFPARSTPTCPCDEESCKRDLRFHNQYEWKQVIKK